MQDPSPTITFRFSAHDLLARRVHSACAAFLLRAVKEGIPRNILRIYIATQPLVDFIARAWKIPGNHDVDYSLILPIYVTLVRRARRGGQLRVRILYDGEETPYKTDPPAWDDLISSLGKRGHDPKPRVTIVTPVGRAESMRKAMLEDHSMLLFFPEHMWAVEEDIEATHKPANG